MTAVFDWSIHYDAIYSTLGVEAIIVPRSSAAEVTLTVIDKTAGIEVLDNGVATILPAAILRVEELTEQGLARDDLRDASITFNGRSWAVRTTHPKPSPDGEAYGEYLLILSAS